MKKRIIWSVLLFIVSSGAYSAGIGRDTCYSFSIETGYAYNTTYQHYGEFCVRAFMPFTPHFEASLSLHASTMNTYIIGLTLRPTIALPVGQVFLENDLYYGAFFCSRTEDFSAALSVGYRMDYMSLQIGTGIRMLQSMDIQKHTLSKAIYEPFNWVYRLEVYARPILTHWNLYAAFGNLTDRQMERALEPLCMLGAYYRIGNHWQVNIHGECAIAGFFNNYTSFYGAKVIVGACYRL